MLGLAALLAVPLAAESHIAGVESVTIRGDIQDPDRLAAYNLAVVCTDGVLVYGLDLTVPSNDPGDWYNLYAGSIRLGFDAVNHLPYTPGRGPMDVRLLDEADLPYPLLIPRYTPLLVPVHVLDGEPGRPVVAALDVAYAAGPGTECRGSQLSGPQRIGLIAPPAGHPETVAAELSLEDYNGRLDDLGERWSLALVTREASGPEEFLRAIRELANEGVRLVAVGDTGDASLAVIGDYAARRGMAVVSCCSSSPTLAEPDHIFRMVPGDTVQAGALAEVLAGDGVRVIVVAHRDDAYGRGMAGALAEEMEGRGGAVGEAISYPAGTDQYDFDRTAQALSGSVRNMLAANPAGQVAVVAVSSVEIARLAESAANHPILDDIRWYVSGRAVGAEGVARGEPGSFAERVGLAGLAVAAPASPLSRDISARIAAELGLPPGSSPGVPAHSIYDSILVLGNAMMATQSAHPDALTEAIPHVAARTYGAMYHAALDGNGDLASSDYDLWRIKDGSWSRVDVLTYRPGGTAAP